MTSASSSRRAAAGATRAAALLLALAGACRRGAPAPAAAPATVDRDTRPFTPWHPKDEPLPFPKTEWYWKILLAIAPAPEPLPQDAEAAARIHAALERVATLPPLNQEEELPALAEETRRAPAAIIAALDDPRDDVRFAAACAIHRVMASDDRVAPQRFVEAAGMHLRDECAQVALMHLETIAGSGFAWIPPILMKTFGKVDNHRLTVLRIRAAAKLAKQHNYSGMAVMIRALKEQTSIQDDINREWDVSPQTAWWKEEAMEGIAAASGGDRFGHSPDASDADQVASIRRIEKWWDENRVRLWSGSPAIGDPVLVERVKLLILGLGTFQIRNVDNSGYLLAGLGPHVAPLLFEALRGSNFMIRRHVLGVLSELVTEVPDEERRRYVAEVEGGLSDRDPAIRVRSLEVIGKSRLPEALTRLEGALAPGDPEVAETALHLLSTWRTPEARSVLERFERSLPPEHALRIPTQAARLAAGDLQGLKSYLQLLGPGHEPDPRAQLYLSWILESDGLAEATTTEARRQALQRIESEIRKRTESQ